MENISIHYGASEPSLSDQLEEQGYRFKSDHERAHLQRAADFITYLEIARLLTAGDCDRVRQRLTKQIHDAIEGL